MTTNVPVSLEFLHINRILAVKETDRDIHLTRKAKAPLISFCHQLQTVFKLKNSIPETLFVCYI